MIPQTKTKDFSGSNYDPRYDEIRLKGQISRIYECMKDGTFRTLGEIEKITGDNQASISAQLRNLRKPAFGKHTINKQPRGERENGLWEYQLIVNKSGNPGSKLGHVRLVLVNLSDYFLAPRTMSIAEVKKFIESKHFDISDFQIVSFTERPTRKSAKNFGEQIVEMDFDNLIKPKIVYFD